MACFGCSKQLYKDNVTQDFKEDLVKTRSLPKKKKKITWISWSRPKKSAAKTVPVSVVSSGNLDSGSKSHLFKLDEVNVVPSKKHKHHTGVNAGIKPYKKKTGTVKEIILENSEMNHLTSLARDDIKHDKKHSSRKKETEKNGSSPPPENKTPVATNRADLTSLPTHREKKTKLINSENGDDNVSVKNQNKGALGSIVGMSIIVVILAIVLFWGKLCAILCTSAWLYMIPRLRTAADSNIIVNNALESDGLNVNSDEHKKKVVLEGLLQRNRRSSVIGLL